MGGQLDQRTASFFDCRRTHKNMIIKPRKSNAKGHAEMIRYDQVNLGKGGETPKNSPDYITYTSKEPQDTPLSARGTVAD